MERDARLKKISKRLEKFLTDSGFIAIPDNTAITMFLLSDYISEEDKVFFSKLTMQEKTKFLKTYQHIKAKRLLKLQPTIQA